MLIRMSIGKTPIYEYDLEVGWQHHITVKDRVAPTEGFHCTWGTGHPAADDCSPEGWESIKKIYRAKRLRREQRKEKDWYEFDPRASAPSSTSTSAIVSVARTGHALPTPSSTSIRRQEPR